MNLFMTAINPSDSPERVSLHSLPVHKVRNFTNFWLPELRTSQTFAKAREQWTNCEVLQTLQKFVSPLIA